MSFTLITYVRMPLKNFVCNYLIAGRIKICFILFNRFFLGKNRVMQVALGRSPEEEYRDNLYKLGEQLGGNCSLFFTNRSRDEMLQFFNEYKSVDYARAGFKATESFVIPKGELPFAHSLFEELKKLRLPVEMKNGVICMREDYSVCKVGKVLTPEQCRILVGYLYVYDRLEVI